MKRFFLVVFLLLIATQVQASLEIVECEGTYPQTHWIYACSPVAADELIISLTPEQHLVTHFVSVFATAGLEVEFDTMSISIKFEVIQANDCIPSTPSRLLGLTSKTNSTDEANLIFCDVTWLLKGVSLSSSPAILYCPPTTSVDWVTWGKMKGLYVR